MSDKKKLVAIVGTTASGKSSLGIELAKHYGTEIVSADSRQVYRHLDLGTGKVTAEEMAEVKHRLIDIIDLGEPFSMAEFQTLAYESIDSIHALGKLPLLVGGTGLYARSVTDGYNLTDAPPNEQLRARLADKSRDELIEILRTYGDYSVDGEVSDRRIVRMIEKLDAGLSLADTAEPRYDVLKLGITFPREVLNRRILERLDARIEEGMIEEVSRVLTLGATPEFLERLGLEYRYTYRYISGQYPSFEAYHEELYREICRFAKRQMTWFRRESDIIWLDECGDMVSEAIGYIDNFLKK
ncbi:MAG: tRNA (adenosine(37)-N6)-dimethylallyltransferase MiaA [Clostridia bacterium]|nr:tRNA (adenosine(37)-N6)-dimethylallyltransferase MiaA [Clostridia bacterium]